MALMTEAQSRAIRCGFIDIDQRMADLEALLGQATSPSPLSRYVNDLGPTEAKVVRDYFARIRGVMAAHLKECGIPLDVRPTSVRWALQCGVVFVGNVVDELRPEKLSGYGALGEEAYARSSKARQDLERLVDQVAAYLRQGAGRDLAGRTARLQRQAAGADAGLLARLQEIVARRRLVEFRPAIETILSRCESPALEVAVFGRVSSGKSSFLNHLAGVDALPVGVTPVTAVPIRMAVGERPSVVVSFAESARRAVGIEELRDYASETGNPGNRKHVVEIQVKLPSQRLKEGVVFVDTPGVGSLALSGGAEALAYLPRCDLGIVLIDAASTLQDDDLALLRALYDAGAPAMVLLSKADLLTPDDRSRAAEYIRDHVHGSLGIDVPVHPVSTVGADESLLIDWYGRELAPLLDRGKELTRESLGRKVAALRESVVAVLETILARRRGGSLAEGRENDAAVTRVLLDEADAAVRLASERSDRWVDGRQALLEQTLRLVAQAVASGRGRTGSDDCALVVRRVLSDRAEAARALAAELQVELARTVESLGRKSPLASVDAESVRSFRLAGLPAPDLEPLASSPPATLPWWAKRAPSLAVGAALRAVEDELGEEIKQVAGLYDRRLQAWARENVVRLTALYEAQASAFREQVRRLSFAPAGDDGAGDAESLEADLEALRPSGTPEEACPVEDFPDGRSYAGSGAK